MQVDDGFVGVFRGFAVDVEVDVIRGREFWAGVPNVWVCERELEIADWNRTPCETSGAGLDQALNFDGGDIGGWVFLGVWDADCVGVQRGGDDG